MSIYEFIQSQKKYTRHDGEVGLELETETPLKYSIPTFTFWDSKGDGSLRDFGVEYVLKQPLLVKKQLPEALEEFAGKTRKIPFKKDSHSTSTHVHVNMLNETFKTFGNFLTAYTLTENILIKYSGPDRLSNLFCLPICDAEDIYRHILHMMAGIKVRNYKNMIFSENQVKYGALNLSAFNSFGSLELRSFRGETDIKEISKWVNIIYDLLEYSRGKRTPHSIMEDFKKSKTKILDEMFANTRGYIKYPDEAKLIDKNLYYAASIAFSIKDWEELDTVEKKKAYKPTSKEILNAALQMGLITSSQSIEALSGAQWDYIVQHLMKQARMAGRHVEPATWTTFTPNTVTAMANNTDT